MKEAHPEESQQSGLQELLIFDDWRLLFFPLSVLSLLTKKNVLVESCDDTVFQPKLTPIPSDPA